MLHLRFRAVRRAEINPRYFLLNRGGKVPDYLLRVEQNYSNLLELPLLFYLLILMLYATRTVDELQLWLAWCHAGTRIVHTAIHTTGNRLRWRMLSFISGALLLLGGWLFFGVRLTQDYSGLVR
jgi:hypothetical protein